MEKNSINSSKNISENSDLQFDNEKSENLQKQVDIEKLGDLLYEFGQDLNNLHKETEALKVKALIYNNKFIVF